MLKNAKKLNRNELKSLTGGLELIPIPVGTTCKCSCTGSVIGPISCRKSMKCPQVITC